MTQQSQQSQRLGLNPLGEMQLPTVRGQWCRPSTAPTDGHAQAVASGQPWPPCFSEVSSPETQSDKCLSQDILCCMKFTMACFHISFVGVLGMLHSLQPCLSCHTSHLWIRSYPSRIPKCRTRALIWYWALSVAKDLSSPKWVPKDRNPVLWKTKDFICSLLPPLPSLPC